MKAATDKRDNMLTLANFYLQKKEPVKSCLLALGTIILQHNEDVTATWKYGMPFFCYKGRMFCYLWVDKKTDLPYLGIVDGKRINHPDLISENRSRMKRMLFNPGRDLPVKTIKAILNQAINLYIKGDIKING